MKITTEDTSIHLFGDVEVCDVFQLADPVWCGDIYMRINSFGLPPCGTVNTLNLTTGEIRFTNDFEKVIIFDAEMKLKRRA